MAESAPGELGPGPRPTAWRRFWPLALVLAVTGLLYWSTCARFLVGSGDSGDFIAAAACNGIPHPSGYPLYIALTWPLLQAETQLMPAFVLNLFSALCGLLAVLVLAELVRRLTGSGLAAAGAALLFATGTPFWLQAVRAEVYALHVLLVMLALGGMLGMLRSARPRWWQLAGLALCLGLGNHLTIITLTPALLYALWQRWPGWRQAVLIAAAGLLLLATLYGGMLLRAQADPAINWCDPSSFTRLYEVLTLKIYGTLRTGDWDFGVKLWALATGAHGQFGAAGLLLIALGAGAAWRERRREALLLMLAVLVPLAAVLLAFSQRDPATLTHAIANHFLMVYAALAVLLGLGIELAARVNHHYQRIAAAVALCGLVVMQGHRSWRSCDLAEYQDVMVYAYNILRQAPPNAVIVTHSDMTGFPLDYFQVAEQVRPDVTVVNDALLGYDWYYPRAGLTAPAGPTPQAKRSAAVAELLRREVGGRGVYVCEGMPDELFTGYERQLQGLLFKVVPAGDSEAEPGRVLTLVDDLIIPDALWRTPPAAELEPAVIRGNLAVALRHGADCALQRGGQQRAEQYLTYAAMLEESLAGADDQ